MGPRKVIVGMPIIRCNRESVQMLACPHRVSPALNDFLDHFKHKTIYFIGQAFTGPDSQDHPSQGIMFSEYVRRTIASTSMGCTEY